MSNTFTTGGSFTTGIPDAFVDCTTSKGEFSLDIIFNDADPGDGKAKLLTRVSGNATWIVVKDDAGEEIEIEGNTALRVLGGRQYTVDVEDLESAESVTVIATSSF